MIKTKFYIPRMVLGVFIACSLMMAAFGSTNDSAATVYNGVSTQPTDQPSQIEDPFPMWGDHIVRTIFYGVNVQLDGKPMQFDDIFPMWPFTLDTVPYLSLRAVGESLGLFVDYNPETNTIMLNDQPKGDAGVRYYSAGDSGHMTGSSHNYIFYGVKIQRNNKPLEFSEDMRPVTIDARAYLPISAISDVFGVSANYDRGANTVYMSDISQGSGVNASNNNNLNDSTRDYINSLDLNSIMSKGADYQALSNAPADPSSYLNGLIEKYKDVDRKMVLHEVFKRLTKDAASETGKEIAVVSFVQELSAHMLGSQYFNALGKPIYDPLILFDIHVMDCQSCARLISDIYTSAGYETRLVDMYGHVVAEIKYDNAWHYADGDFFGGGQIVRMPDGHIPSMAELSKNYTLLDKIQPYIENSMLLDFSAVVGAKSNAPWIYPSYNYFSKNYYANHAGYPRYVYKNEGGTGSVWNGWDKTVTEPAGDITLSDIQLTETPRIPQIAHVEQKTDGLIIMAADTSNAQDVQFEAFVSSKPRGWDYSKFKGDPAAQSYWHDIGGWKPVMYDNLFKLPPLDIGVFRSDNNQITINNLPNENVYITIMATDSYGRRIGKELYLLSNELIVVR